MDIYTGAMNTLLPKLGLLLLDEYKLQKGVKREIEELRKELASMNAALRKVSGVPVDRLDELTKIWARDVRDLSYDIEDAIDSFMLRGKQGHGPASTFSFKGFIERSANLFNKAKTNHQISSVIKDILDQVKKVRERYDRYKVDDVAARPITATVDHRLEAMYKEATELVGIDGPKNELAPRLIEKPSSLDDQPKIISIIGLGGLGKTTVANALLRDLKPKFESHVFVAISLNPDINRILRSILNQVDPTSNANEASDHMEIINKIRKTLETRRWLCVIDDIWKETVWDTIKFAFQVGGRGSKLIITTRNKSVAEYTGGEVYELKGLSDDDSRKLFYKRIFYSEDDCLGDLSVITEKILKKCGGVPLAIITISSLLANKPRTKEEWEKVNKSIGSEHENRHDVDKMMTILRLSYYDLPYHLKTCLLSLSKFPEDTIIMKSTLVWSWLAEDFITEEAQPAGTSLQEIGEGYFSELVNRSLIQPVETREFRHDDGEVIACQVHDMVLELIYQLSNEEGFVTTLLSDGQLAGTHTTRTPDQMQTRRIRRLSLHGGSNNDASVSHLLEAKEDQLSKVRSLTVFSKVDSIPTLSSFHVLRVLQLEDCSGLNDNCLEGLSELRHLRFLRLLGYKATELPEGVWKLKSLETLEITGADRVVVLLPLSLTKLRKLVRLFTRRVQLADDVVLEDMESLQELGIDFTPQVVKEISKLKEIRVVKNFFSHDRREGNSNMVESVMTCLERCSNLRILDIQCNLILVCSLDSVQHVPSGLQRFLGCQMRIKAFPWWINSLTLPGLTTLSIELTEHALLPQHLVKLAELPSLRFLRIHVSDFSKRRQKLTVPSGPGTFRCLRIFHFYCASMFLTFEPGAMPMLQRLYLFFYFGLQSNNIDFGLENLRSLRHVIIDCNGGGGNQKAETDAIAEKLKHNPNHPSLKWVL